MKPVGILALTAAAYWLAATGALALALPPGYSTAVWPAAGVGAACALVWGRWACVGVWLGSWAANAPNGLTLGCIIGIGAGAQALLARELVRRVYRWPLRAESPRQIAGLLTLIGPLACVLSASVGVGALVAFERVQLAESPYQWWTWYLGDSMGAVIFAPLIWAWVAEPADSWRPRRLSLSIIAAGCLAFGAAIAIKPDLTPWLTVSLAVAQAALLTWIVLFATGSSGLAARTSAEALERSEAEVARALEALKRKVGP